MQGYLDEVEVAFAGSTPGGDGFWVPPSVVTTEDPAARIWREEVFGPVVAVMPFDDEAHAVELANDTEYGLSGSIYTADLGRGLRVARGGRGRQPQRQLATPRCATGRRSAATSSPASAASSARTPRWRSPRRRTSSSPTEVSHALAALATSTHRKEPTMAGRIQGKVAVVTGGCSGIGLATVQRFVEEGARVVVGDIDEQRGHEIVGQLGGTDLATFVKVDVTDKEQVDALFQTAKDTYGSVDIAFNNAGHLARRRTTRSSTPTSTPGAGCRRST